MARLLALAVLILTGCASSGPVGRYARLAGQDVIAVAKAPAREWKTLAVAGAATGAALLLDDEIARVVRNNDSHALDELTSAIEPFGGGHSDKVIAGFLLYGVAVRNDRARAVAFDAFMSSVIASKGITPALKQLTRKSRPGGGNDDSFPSNHATQAFAVASVIASHHRERPWVRWLAYGVAGGVGFARVYNEAHHTSDVIAGAVIGSLVGHTIARTNRLERSRWTVTPMAHRRGASVLVQWRGGS